MRRGSRIAIVSAIFWMCIGCDQSTKRIAEHTLQFGEAKAIFNGVVRLMYAENRGAWGSYGEHLPETLKLILLVGIPGLFLLGFAARVLSKPSTTKLEVIGAALVVGGGFGNLIDRVLYGHVVDFMYVGFGRIGTNIFNVADVAIMIGMALLIYTGFRRHAPMEVRVGAQQTP